MVARRGTSTRRLCSTRASEHLSGLSVGQTRVGAAEREGIPPRSHSRRRHLRLLHQCFSAAAVQILTNLGIEFNSVNVLDSDDMREGIKKFSNWPTIPQLYVKEEFIGGCDIVKEMYDSGELLELFNTRGIEIKPS